MKIHKESLLEDLSILRAGLLDNARSARERGDLEIAKTYTDEAAGVELAMEVVRKQTVTWS